MQPNAADLVSGEGVRLALVRAGVGSRTIAATIDAAIQLVALFVLLLIDIPLIGSADDAAAAAVSLVETVAVLAGYPIVMEWTTHGRTVGKLCFGLRVVRDDGGPIRFWQALVRGLAGLVLEKPGLLFPFTTIAGVVTIATSAEEKRIGDMMAGTIVLNERAANQQPVAAPWWVPPPLQPWVLALDLHRLDDELAQRTREFVTRSHALSPDAQAVLGEDLRRRVLAVTSPPPPSDAPTRFVLAGVLAERRRRAFAGAAPPVQHYGPGSQPGFGTNHPSVPPYPAVSPPPAAAPDSPFAPPR